MMRKLDGKECKFAIPICTLRCSFFFGYTFNNSKKEFVDYFSGKRGQQPIIGDDDSNSSSFACLSLHDEVLVCACVHATTMMINRGDEGEGGDDWYRAAGC